MQPADVQLVKHLIEEAVDENEIIDLTSPPYDEKGEGGKGGRGIFNHPFKVSLVSFEESDIILVSKGRAHFWKKDLWVTTAMEITDEDTGWTATVDTEGVYTAEYIYAQLTYDGTSWSWDLGHDTANPQDGDDQEQTTWIIAYLNTDGSIDQRLNQDIYETSGS